MTRKSKPQKSLPAASLHIVLALLDGELHGYAVMHRVGELSDGAVKMGPGTLYGTLNRLVGDGLVVETTDRVDRGDDDGGATTSSPRMADRSPSSNWLACGPWSIG